MLDKMAFENPSFTTSETELRNGNPKKETNTTKSDTKEENGLDLKTKLFVYVSHFLSAWGDRMWSFGIGLFLIELAPESLQLVAIYGFSRGISVLLFAAIIGDWVDNTPRLKAARISLVLQNVLVVVCVAVVFSVVTFQDTLRNAWADEGALTLCHAIIIILTILSDLASVARKIAVERDWIVEICGRDKDLLASMSATMRAIDLTTAILAPVATGQIIYFIALRFGAVFIGGWNVVSVFVEYILIWKVYDLVPALKSKKYKKRKDRESEEENQAITPSDDAQLHEQTIQSEAPAGGADDIKIEEGKPVQQSSRSCPPVCYKLFKSFITLVRGWKIYMKYNVAFAGLGLACLYMTVLGFDNITVGYAYSQGISESILGILMAVGSVFGIAGTFAYPRLQKRIGLERTGLIGLGSEILCLCLCVASVFAPGSPFDLLHRMKNKPSLNITTVSTTPRFESFENTTVIFNVVDNKTVLYPAVTTAEQTSYISIGLYLSGLITARFGLWVADLTITQLFLQSVVETERGIVSGIQSSLNQLMDMLKFLMVILAPYPQEYGLLVFISFGFVVMGWVLYSKYSFSVRGHILPFHKMCMDSHNNNMVTNEVTETGSVVLDANYGETTATNNE